MAIEIMVFGFLPALAVVALGGWVILRNLAERKRAEATLKEQRNLMRTVMDHFPDLICVKDRESRFILANRGLAQFVGAPTPEALVGKTDMDLFPREHAERYFADEIDLPRVCFVV